MNGKYSFGVAEPRQLEQALRLRFEVYCLEKGWLDPNRYPEGLEQDEYDEGQSMQFVAVASTSEVVACFRLITHGRLGFPCEKHFNLTKQAENQVQTVEMSRLIIAEGHRGFRVTREIILGLSREIYVYNLDNGIRWCYAAVEPGLLTLVRRMGIPFEQAGRKSDYMGETLPMLLDMQDVEDKMSLENPDLYRYFRSRIGSDRQWTSAAI